MTTFIPGEDSRTWVDKMFVDLSPEGLRPLEVLIKDSASDSSLTMVEIPSNSIPLLVDFAANSGSPHPLKGESIVILGGCRATRASLGRLCIPASQLPKFIEYLTDLNNFITSDAVPLIQQVRDSR